MLAFGIVIPVLPHLVQDFVGGDLAAAARWVGVFGSAFVLAQFLASPLQGALSDRFGRRPVILVSNAGLALDFALMALAQTLPLLLIGRIISGITAASVGTANAYIADVTPPEKRAGAFGLLGAAFGIGFVIGPALGGLLGSVDLRLPFWVAGGLALANFCWGWFVLPESLPKERRAAFSWRQASPIGPLLLIRRYPAVFALVAIAVLSQFAHYVLPSTFVLYADYRYGWDERDVGWVFALVGVSNALVQALLVRKLVPKIGERRAVLIGFAAGTVGFATMGLANVGSVFLIAIPFLALWGLAGPSLQALMSARVGASEQGRLQGAVTSLASLASIGAPLAFSTVFAGTIAAGSNVYFPGAAFVLSAALLTVALIIAWRSAFAAPTVVASTP